jgi:hypothetical protein
MLSSVFRPLCLRSRRFRAAQAGIKSGRSTLRLELLEDRTLPSLTWSTGIALPSARSGDAAILETDNSILVLGGSGTVNRLVAGGTAWTTANPLDVSRSAPGVAPIGGGELLVYGGVANETGQSSALQYDPTNSSNIQAVASMSTVRSLMAFAADGSGRAYAIGGMIAGDDIPTRLASVERFDPATGQWSAVAPLPVGVSGAAAVYDGNGHILVFGGATSSASATATAYRYTVATNTWATLSALPTATTEAAAALGADGTVYVLGGLNTSGAAQTTVQAYHPTTNTWTTETALPVALSDEAAVTDSQGSVEVLGGKNAQHSSVSSVYVTQSVGTGNVAPVIATPANTTAVIGAQFTDAINAFGLPAPTFSLTAAPTGMTIDSASGLISWTPTSGQLGAQTVTVQATNASGTDTKTFTVTGVPDTTPPTVPQNLTLGTVTTTTASFSWLPSTDNVAVAGYRIFTYVPGYGGGHGTQYHPPVYTLVGTSTTTSGTATGLTPGASYNFVVAAYDTSNNQSGYSNIVTTTMLLAPSIFYSDNGVDVDPPVSVIANHSLLLSVWDPGNPSPTLSIVSAPSGVAFMFYGSLYLTWTPTASQVGVNHIVLQSVNSVGTATLDIPVTVVADVAIPTLSVNGGLTYSLGNYVADPINPFTYSLTLNPGFGITGNHPQYALAGTPFAFQLGGTTNTNPVTYTLVSGPAGMTLDPNTGAGTWAPTADQAGPTSVTVQETNSAGTSTLTFSFPNYFTTAPTNVAVNFYTSTSSTGSQPPDFTPVVSWTAPADSSRVADYLVQVTDAHTQVTTNYDTQSTSTSFALTGVANTQQFVTVVALDANGNPSITSGAANLYILAQPAISWSFSTPNAVAGSPLSVQFQPASPYFSYSIASGPAAVTINPTSGLLFWTPGLGDVGTANRVVAATNGWGTTFVTLNFPVYFTSAVQAVSVTNDSAFIYATWTAPPENAANIVGYNVTLSYTVNGQTFTATYTTPTAATAYAIPVPVYDNTIVYHLSVTAFDAAGDIGAPNLHTYDFTLT